jgi:thiamine-phosphate pyrophosphorylase|tara:strand:+ start:979 stop:1584 length:606 start_codon:yes stop_codon:yes gene_type:complete
MHKNLPKYYYFIDKFEKDDIKNINKNIAIIYRNYTRKIDIKLIQNIKDILKKKKIKFFLANNIKLAIKLNLDGVYIPSFNKEFKINSYSKKKKFLIIGSAHNLKEIKIKEKQGTQIIFLSSLFKNNKTNKFLGPIKFNILSKMTKKKLVALGGINQTNIQKLFLLNTYGFASISFLKNTDKLNINRVITKQMHHTSNIINK